MPSIPSLRRDARLLAEWSANPEVKALAEIVVHLCGELEDAVKLAKEASAEARRAKRAARPDERGARRGPSSDPRA